MNIFATHSDPYQAANFLWDNDFKRANKMILESTQLLCTAINVLAEKQVTPYKSTHVNHPCSKWVRESYHNWAWLYTYAMILATFYYETRGRNHKCFFVLKDIAALGIETLPTNPITSFVNCARNTKLGLDFTHLEVHTAYKQYLQTKWDRENV